MSSQDVASQEQPNVSSKPAKKIIGAKPTESCAICSETVYPVEKLMIKGKVLHKSCLRCSYCNKLLELATFATLDDKFYCKPHFNQVNMSGVEDKAPTAGATGLKRSVTSASKMSYRYRETKKEEPIIEQDVVAVQDTLALQKQKSQEKLQATKEEQPSIPEISSQNTSTDVAKELAPTSAKEKIVETKVQKSDVDVEAVKRGLPYELPLTTAPLKKEDGPSELKPSASSTSLDSKPGGLARSKTMRQYGQKPTETCAICEKLVYPTEKIFVEKKILHANCLRCKDCNKILSMATYNIWNGEFYCKPHAMKRVSENPAPIITPKKEQGRTQDAPAETQSSQQQQKPSVGLPSKLVRSENTKSVEIPKEEPKAPTPNAEPPKQAEQKPIITQKIQAEDTKRVSLEQQPPSSPVKDSKVEVPKDTLKLENVAAVTKPQKPEPTKEQTNIASPKPASNEPTKPVERKVEPPENVSAPVKQKTEEIKPVANASAFPSPSKREETITKPEAAPRGLPSKLEASRAKVEEKKAETETKTNAKQVDKVPPTVSATVKTEEKEKEPDVVKTAKVPVPEEKPKQVESFQPIVYQRSKSIQAETKKAEQKVKDVEADVQSSSMLEKVTEVVQKTSGITSELTKNLSHVLLESSKVASGYLKKDSSFFDRQLTQVTENVFKVFSIKTKRFGPSDWNTESNIIKKIGMEFISEKNEAIKMFQAKVSKVSSPLEGECQGEVPHIGDVLLEVNGRKIKQQKPHEIYNILAELLKPFPKIYQTKDEEGQYVLLAFTFVSSHSGKALNYAATSKFLYRELTARVVDPSDREFVEALEPENNGEGEAETGEIPVEAISRSTEVPYFQFEVEVVPDPTIPIAKNTKSEDMAYSLEVFDLRVVSKKYIGELGTRAKTSDEESTSLHVVLQILDGELRNGDILLKANSNILTFEGVTNKGETRITEEEYERRAAKTLNSLSPGEIITFSTISRNRLHPDNRKAEAATENGDGCVIM